MIEVEPIAENVGLTAHGILTRADYRQVLIPRLEKLIEQHGPLKVLFLLDDDFEGWDLDASWDNTTFDFRHRNDFAKIAVVGAPKWEEWCVRSPRY
jgi:hypothetical protein